MRTYITWALALLLLACKSQQGTPEKTSAQGDPNVSYTLYYVPAFQTAYLLDQEGRYHHSWHKQENESWEQLLSFAVPLPTPQPPDTNVWRYLNPDRDEAGKPLPVLWGGAFPAAAVKDFLSPQPPFNAIEVKQSQTRAKNDRQYKRLMRETFVEIEAGYLDEAFAYLQIYLAQEPEDAEALYCMALWLTQRYRFEEAIDYLDKAIAAGLARERFLAGPDVLWQPLWDSEAFRKWLGPQDIPLLIHGPMLGDLTDRSVQVWGRTFSENKLQVVVLDEQGREVQRVSGAGMNERERTFCLQVEGLEPQTTYQYYLEVDGRAMQDPIAFRTRASKGESSVFRLVFGGGAGYTPQFERMWNTIAAHQPDALLLLGDNVYIDHPERPATQQYCYHRRQSRPEWRQLSQKTPVYTIWDDHDFTYNDERGGAAVDSPYWKREVLRVFQNQWANPYYGSGESQPGCYYDFAIGDVDFFMLDTRYYREDPKTDGASMLGPIQKQWLKDKLLASDATFKVICTSVPFSENTKPGSLDTWDGHAEEREEIRSFLTANEVEGVLFIAADRHRSDAWKTEREGDYPIYEFMSSRLTNIHTHKIMEASLFGYNEKCSFGQLDFNTELPDPELTYRIFNIDNEEIHSLTLKRSELE
jgi:alkaline phosphatase D